MPKITRHGGPSIADELRARGKLGPYGEPADTEGSEPSPGNSSETSPEKQPKSDETNSADLPKPAPTTAPRSKRRRGAGSTARSTAGDGPDGD